MIGIIDTGAGNLYSLIHALKTCGAVVERVDAPVEPVRYSKLILPGVGAAGSAMRLLRDRGLDVFLTKAVQSGIDLLGICLGMQLLFESSAEDETVCLGILKGYCVRMQCDLKIPHMGWNRVEQCRSHSLWEGIEDASYFYFAHSFCAMPFSPDEAIGLTAYGQPFVSAVCRDRVAGVQFHPEKSQRPGLRFLNNFVNQQRRQL